MTKWIPTMPDGDVVTESGELICECRPCHSRLIAAAPDMLAALRRVECWARMARDAGHKDAEADLQAIRAAIAKATGA